MTWMPMTLVLLMWLPMTSSFLILIPPLPLLPRLLPDQALAMLECLWLVTLQDFQATPMPESRLLQATPTLELRLLQATPMPESRLLQATPMMELRLLWPVAWQGFQDSLLVDMALAVSLQ